MEGSSSVSQLEGVQHWFNMRYPTWSRLTSYLKGMLMLIMFTTIFQGVASTHIERTYFDTPRPWNKNLYKIELGCKDFHLPNDSSLFYYWPEDDPHFDHCCSPFLSDGGMPIVNFTYGMYGPQLGYVVYYDLGLIDQCFPYWKCSNLYKSFYETSCSMYTCERTDLERLYSRRFWNGSVLEHGLLQSALPFSVSLEILVLLFALYCLWRQRVIKSRLQIMKKASNAWVQVMHKTVLTAWLHLYLLAIIGNGLIEAVGRQNVYYSQSKSFYNYARLYVALSVLVWVSSFLQQISYWIAVIEDHGRPILPLAGQTSGADYSHSTAVDPPQSQNTPHLCLKKLEEKIGLNDDWKWQPIAAQVGILFCLWGFLTYSDDGDSMSAGVFGIVVQAAAPWSGLLAVKIIIKTLPFLYDNLKPSILEMRRQRRTVSLCRVHSEDPSAPLGLEIGQRSDQS